MKFWNFGKKLLIAALSAGVIFGFTSCTQSFTVGFIYITGTVTGSPGGTNGIISGYNIDNNTGKLTAIHGLPVGSGGSNPSRAVMLTGGRFIYVLNMGVNKLGTDCSTVTTAQLISDPADYQCQGANIALFTIGGTGILTPEGTYATQGINPYRLISDPSGNYIMALEKSAPANSDAKVACQAITLDNLCGDITVFSIDQTTGRLSTIQNAQLTANSSGAPLTYFPVPSNPVDFTFASGYLMTVAAPNLNGYTTGNVEFPYTYTSTNGQLTLNSNSIGNYVITNGNGDPVLAATNIIYASSYVYISDNEPITTTNPVSVSQILPFTVSGGALVSQVGGAVPNDPTLANPVNLMVESKGKYLFAISDGNGPSSSNPASGITQYVIDPSSHQLTFNSPTTTGTGADPRCILEDPTNQYVYTANSFDSTINAHVLDPNTGVLSPLRGNSSISSFTLSGPATWCIMTGRTR